jgi:phage-related protein
MKELFWIGSTLEDLRAFPPDARRIAGHELHLVQQGIEPDDWKPMASVGSGVYELRIHTGVEHRVFYVAKFAEGIYILHAFQKKPSRWPHETWSLRGSLQGTYREPAGPPQAEVADHGQQNHPLEWQRV